jgi:hypothetical protein
MMNAGPVFDEDPELPLEPEDGEELTVEPQPLASRTASGTDKRERNSVLPEHLRDIVGHPSCTALLLTKHPQAHISRCAPKRFFVTCPLGEKEKDLQMFAQQESAGKLVLRQNRRCHL